MNAACWKLTIFLLQLPVICVAQQVDVEEALRALDQRDAAFERGQRDNPDIPPDLEPGRTDALPRLFRALAGDPGGFEKRWVNQQFQRMDRAAIEYLFNSAPRTIPEEYRTFLDLLRRNASRDSRTWYFVEEALHHSDPDVRQFAAYSVGRHPPQSTLLRLSELTVNDDNFNSARACSQQLGAPSPVDDDIVRLMVEGLQDSPKQERWGLMGGVLGRFSHRKEELVPILLDIGANPDGRNVAIAALGGLRADSPEVIAFIEPSLYEPQFQSDGPVLWVLARIGPTAYRLMPRIIELLFDWKEADPERRVGRRSQFAKTLESIAPDDPRVKEALIETSLIQDPYEYMNICVPDVGIRDYMVWARKIDDFDNDGIDDLAISNPKWSGSGGRAYELFLREPESNGWISVGSFFGVSSSLGHGRNGEAYLKSFGKSGGEHGTWQYVRVEKSGLHIVWSDHGAWKDKTASRLEWVSDVPMPPEVAAELRDIEWTWNPYSGDRCECVDGQPVWDSSLRHPP